MFGLNETFSIAEFLNCYLDYCKIQCVYALRLFFYKSVFILTGITFLFICALQMKLKSMFILIGITC